ncbi:hypothetical protein [Luteolibacter luteus]|uniref:CopG family transcriptional regulator n=1 Tax=Luteolibacter luteus TaxID=2728835 RepID=A0A858RIE3_9BACT|nr:hypothetical protein [Luteolibacter luteus]QJE95990.1 hypothetical protein HHL09_09410 [Luteolibacter luteus]
MQSQIVNPNLPEWADGLPEQVVSTVRQEAIRRGIRPSALVKEWTVKAARDLTTDDAQQKPVTNK